MHSALAGSTLYSLAGCQQLNWLLQESCRPLCNTPSSNSQPASIVALVHLLMTVPLIYGLCSKPIGRGLANA